MIPFFKVCLFFLQAYNFPKWLFDFPRIITKLISSNDLLLLHSVEILEIYSDIIWQKFRESNVLTNEVSKESISQNISSVRVNFSIFHTVCNRGLVSEMVAIPKSLWGNKSNSHLSCENKRTVFTWVNNWKSPSGPAISSFGVVTLLTLHTSHLVSSTLL